MAAPPRARPPSACRAPVMTTPDGTLTLRAPRTNGGTGIGIAVQNGGSLRIASDKPVIAEGFQSYQAGMLGGGGYELRQRRWLLRCSGHEWPAVHGRAQLPSQRDFDRGPRQCRDPLRPSRSAARAISRWPAAWAPGTWAAGAPRWVRPSISRCARAGTWCCSPRSVTASPATARHWAHGRSAPPRRMAIRVRIASRLVRIFPQRIHCRWRRRH